MMKTNHAKDSHHDQKGKGGQAASESVENNGGESNLNLSNDMLLPVTMATSPTSGRHLQGLAVS